MKIKQIAEKTGCAERTLQVVAGKLGFLKIPGKKGMEYDLDKAEVKELIANLHYKRGRPPRDRGDE
jgi:hypothetical protein